jgi:hypothetical protein
MGDRQSTIQVIELNAIGGWHTLHSNIYLAVTGGVGRRLMSLWLIVSDHAIQIVGENYLVALGISSINTASHQPKSRQK